MEVKKYNPFVIIKPKPKVRPEAKIMLEAGGLSLESKEKLDIIYARVLLRQVRNSYNYNYQELLRRCLYDTISTILFPSLFTIITFLVNTNA